MAGDEVLLDEPAGGREEAVLRFYRWSEACLSIGYFQDMEETRRKHGDLPIVRRITGGGMVRHGDDLTVSLALPVPNPFFPAKALDSYGAIHRIFIDSLKRAHPGLQTVRSKSPLKPRSPSNCFEEPVAYDVELEGRKVIGSSQRRRRGRMLHQTAVLLPGDPGRIADAVRGGFERGLGVRFREQPLTLGEQERAAALARSKYAVDMQIH